MYNINSYIQNSEQQRYYVNAVCRLQTFESPVGFYNADVGRCVATELFNVTDTSETDATPEVPSFTVKVTHPEPWRSTTTRPTGPTLASADSVNSRILISVDQGHVTVLPHSAVTNNIAILSVSVSISHTLFGLCQNSKQLKFFYHKSQ